MLITANYLDGGHDGSHLPTYYKSSVPPNGEMPLGFHRLQNVWLSQVIETATRKVVANFACLVHALAQDNVHEARLVDGGARHVADEQFRARNECVHRDGGGVCASAARHRAQS